MEGGQNVSLRRGKNVSLRRGKNVSLRRFLADQKIASL